ncbi:glycosyltransferase family 2 protein [Flavobacterium sp.]|uniref:glycosyltransferase family 2 protein n=1 Tax=Flavobacterium sp. TaxID=239 RepID=UPI00286EAD42|nr:glycosyltransferase family 2 protein [Flavobacterium sp.]
MLSILIPTYNYNALPLVEKLYEQCVEAEIVFEIIVLDDKSTDLNFLIENSKINTKANCKFDVLENNIGRSAIRNLLAKKAAYEDLLFLDVDTIPVHKNFISTYVSQINKEERIVYGGILYQNQKPHKTQLLRWVYGNKREALSVKERNKNVYVSFLTLNFLIKKNIFNKVLFNENIPNLRHEDTLFSFDLKRNQISISHLNNPVYHIGIENSIAFLKKSEESIIGLHFLISNNYLDYNYTKLGLTYFYLKKMRVIEIVNYLFTKVKFLFKRNLLSKNPSLFIFDLYRICYYCSLK